MEFLNFQKNKIFYFILFLTLLFSQKVRAEDFGVVLGEQFRFSQNNFFAGQDVRFYISIQNYSGFDVGGTVQFYDNDKFLNDFNFKLVQGKTMDTWTDWRPVEGEHTLKAKISSLQKIEIAKNPESIEVKEILERNFNRFIDIDTDKDGIGNQEDLDDDNDGFTDADEVRQGTDPLVFNQKNNENNGSGSSSLSLGNLNSQSLNTLKEKITDLNYDDAKVFLSGTAGSIFDRLKNLREITKNSLESEKERVDSEIFLENSKTMPEELKKVTNESPRIASVIEATPSLKEFYSFILGIFIAVLNSWWLLLGTILVTLYLILKILKNRWGSRYEY
ncbi:MAG: thrombospondin type 3 repeat-containing protein [Patescibacteria group bacterium]